MSRDTKLVEINKAARSHSTKLNGVTLRFSQGSTVLVSTIGCWITAVVIRTAMEREGWKVEEVE